MRVLQLYCSFMTLPSHLKEKLLIQLNNCLSEDEAQDFV